MHQKISTVPEYNPLYVYLCSQCNSVSSYNTNTCSMCTNDTRKGEVHPITCHEGTEWEERYNSTLSLTLVLDKGEWLTPCPGQFTPQGMTQQPLYRGLGGPRGQSGQVRKTSPPPGFNPQTVHSVASSYSDHTVLARNYETGNNNVHHRL